MHRTQNEKPTAKNNILSIGTKYGTNFGMIISSPMALTRLVFALSMPFALDSIYFSSTNKFYFTSRCYRSLSAYNSNSSLILAIVYSSSATIASSSFCASSFASSLARLRAFSAVFIFFAASFYTASIYFSLSEFLYFSASSASVFNCREDSS